ncbi:MAG: ABC transporter ATP-binding protein [Rhodobacteraceae bacterium]|nr:ABC transporter ATP-binding protein [Paracoccaceae bacterium]
MELSDSALTTVPHDSSVGKFLLEVEDLHVHFVTSRGVVRAVEGISYKVESGETVAIVGESGCGKSVSSLAIMGLLPKPTGKVVGGRILFEGRNLLDLTQDEMREIRGRDIAMIFQEPMTSLNPVLGIGSQIMEPLFIHMGNTKEQARDRAIELLDLVGISDPERRLDQYPHQLSGGMRQRIMIAIGLTCNPKLIIADEPTTALDVTIQAQILKLMKDLSERLGIALIIITHNLGIVARYADRVNVMYAARMVEQCSARDLFAKPLHPYSAGLLHSVPRLDNPREKRLGTIDGLPPNLLDPPAGCRFAARCKRAKDACKFDQPELVEIEAHRFSACIRADEMARETPPLSKPAEVDETSTKIKERDQPLLQVNELCTYFGVTSGSNLLRREKFQIRAVDGLSFDIHRGETVGLVGESGCGKTTVGRTLLGLEKPTAGEVLFDGLDISRLKGQELTDHRRSVQAVFQDPYSSLNPRMTVGSIIAEPMHVYRLEPSQEAVREKVRELLVSVGLFDYMADRYPHELSGGQRQRIGIARALAMQPSFIVCDEPVSALDVSIQGQIINLMEELQSELGLTYLFIAHDLAVVRHMSDRVVVMYLGRVMEIAYRDDLYGEPLHPYTKALLNAVPIPDPQIETTQELRLLKGEIPSPLNPPKGCVFHTRCEMASEECKHVIPEFREVKPDHYAACLKL